MSNRRVNLLPRELLVRRRARQRVLTIAAVVAAVIVLLIGVFVFESVRLASERNKLDAQEQRNAKIQSELDKLAEFEALSKEAKGKTELVAALTTREVRWSVLLADISFVIPSDAWLTNFVGTVNDETGKATKSVLGTIQMNGTTFTHVDVAKWLTRLADVEGFANPYLTLSSKSQIGSTEVVTFTSTVDLADAALRANQSGGARVI